MTDATENLYERRFAEEMADSELMQADAESERDRREAAALPFFRADD
jgi:hypothetical protein